MYDLLHFNKILGIRKKGMQQGMPLSNPMIVEIILVLVFKMVLRGEAQEMWSQAP